MGLNASQSLPLENHQPLQSALLEHMQETLKKHSEEILVAFSLLELNRKDLE